jgi:hypothetical protein
MNLLPVPGVSDCFRPQVHSFFSLLSCTPTKLDKLAYNIPGRFPSCIFFWLCVYSLPIWHQRTWPIFIKVDKPRNRAVFRSIDYTEHRISAHLLLPIWNLPGTVLGSEAGYNDLKFFLIFLSSFRKMLLFYMAFLSLLLICNLFFFSWIASLNSKEFRVSVTPKIGFWILPGSNPRRIIPCPGWSLLWFL